MIYALLAVLAQTTTGPSAGETIGWAIMVILYLAVVLVVAIGAWKMYVKAGQPGWGILIPIYNVYLMCLIAGRPGWWVILTLIPGVNVIIALILSLDIAKAFGKGAGFGLGLFFLGFIFVPILGFGSATYKGA